MAVKINIIPVKPLPNDFWGIGNLPDVLEQWEGAKVPESRAEIETAITTWKAQGRVPEIVPCGQGRVGNGYGDYALLGSRLNGGVLDSQVYVLTAMDRDACVEFAHDLQIKVF